MSDDHNLIPTPRSIAGAFPWLVDGLRSIVERIAEGRPGLARTEAEALIAKLEGKTS